MNTMISPSKVCAVASLVSVLPLLSPAAPPRRQTGEFVPAQAPIADLPAHGSGSVSPAKDWDSAMVSGNGVMGALVFGVPNQERIIISHERNYLDWVPPLKVPNMSPFFARERQLIREGGLVKGYGAAKDFYYQKGKELGYERDVIVSFHPGVQFLVNLPQRGPARDYLRMTDFATGEVTTRWHDDAGNCESKVFVSRTDGVVVLRVTRTRGKLDCELGIDQSFFDQTVRQATRVGGKQSVAAISLADVLSTETTNGSDWSHTCATYKKGKGGYDIDVRVIARGGTVIHDGTMFKVGGADEALALLRITMRDGSDGKILDHVRDEKGLGQLPADYATLLRRHVKVHGEIFNRVVLDLDASPADRAATSEELLERAASEGKLSSALLEKMYDAGRYMFISSCGELPPNLQGKWTGTWSPPWCGSYTLDTNLQLAIAAGLSANMPESLTSLFNLVDFATPDWRENARKLTGCRGLLTGMHVNNTGLNFHWGTSPWQFWTAGAGWIAHWYFDYFQFTGDRKFLQQRAVPFMKEVALFYEDYLFVDESGRYRFSPSLSPENGLGDNATMDIAVCKQLLTNLVAACSQLGIEQENIPKWRAMIAKLPDYMINEEGALKEWSIPEKGENYNHRHYSHLYPLFQSYEFSPERTPKLWRAAEVALEKRMEFWARNASTDTSSHGRMHAGLCAARLGKGEVAWELLTKMAVGGSYYPSLVTSHFSKHRTFNVDANGATPEIINNMLLFTFEGQMDLLPALPQALPRGKVRGLLQRGQIRIDSLAWDRPAGLITLELTSAVAQTITLRVPKAPAIEAIISSGSEAQVHEISGKRNARTVTLPAGKTVLLDVKL